MVCVLKARDPKTYVDAHDRLEWDNTIVDEYHSLMKNDTWDLVPQLQINNAMKC
jgi:hypothetical protein